MSWQRCQLTMDEAFYVHPSLFLPAPTLIYLFISVKEGNIVRVILLVSFFLSTPTIRPFLYYSACLFSL